MSMLSFLRLSSALLLTVAPTITHGAVFATASESGGNVVFSASGSLNTDGLTSSGGVAGFGFVLATSPDLVFGAGNYDSYDGPSFTSPSAFGTNMASISPAVFPPGDDNFGVLSDGLGSGTLFVPDGYVSGTALSGSLTFTGTDISTMNLIPGEYVWSWGSGGTADTFTLTVVPEPSTCLLSLIGVTFLLRRRR